MIYNEFKLKECGEYGYVKYLTECISDYIIKNRLAIGVHDESILLDKVITMRQLREEPIDALSELLLKIKEAMVNKKSKFNRTVIVRAIENQITETFSIRLRNED